VNSIVQVPSNLPIMVLFLIVFLSIPLFILFILAFLFILILLNILSILNILNILNIFLFGTLFLNPSVSCLRAPSSTNLGLLLLSLSPLIACLCFL
jgi:hypothetical protein